MRNAPLYERREEPRACRIALRGNVQGHGVRPAIARLARLLHLTGSVCNSSRGVLIQIEGPSHRICEFQTRLLASLPASALVEGVSFEDSRPRGEQGFHIMESSTGGPLRARVPPDVAVCPDCLSDVADPRNRRYGYLLATCTICGPRYSIVGMMPYDRAASGMSHFAMCPSCIDEYTNRDDRRFHSQTNCCRACGPHVFVHEPAKLGTANDEDAIKSTADALRAGRILALRGIGGYQLLVDATSELAVRELRRRKRRLGKPFAVMVVDRMQADRLAVMSRLDEEMLCSPSNPIVVLSKREGAGLAPAVCVGFRSVGLLLPTTPLHYSIARAVGGPLVVTSGNFESDPLIFDEEESEHELSGTADLWLHHDRPIVRPIDDSVVRVIAGRAATVRLARGFAPLPIEIESQHKIIALGGHQKAAIAVANGAQLVLGPHVGDLETEVARRRYVEHVTAMQQLYDFEPVLIVHDEHPTYFTSQWASLQPVATMAVQHHHAHVAAGMIEKRWSNREVLGVAWDGTGYGPDGTVWGGEFLVATRSAYRRVAHLRVFKLPGGEAAVREPWRVAVALVLEALGPDAAVALRFGELPVESAAHVAQIAQKPHLSLRTSSAGRLFDAIAALVLDIYRAEFESQPAMLLESVCDRSAEGQYHLPFIASEPGILDWRPLIGEVLEDRRSGISPGRMAMRFHRALAQGIVSVAENFPGLPIVLGGGCFYNQVLTELVNEALASRGREIATPGAIPVGDGGLAAGQLAIAVARLDGGWRPCV